MMAAAAAGAAAAAAAALASAIAKAASRPPEKAEATVLRWADSVQLPEATSQREEAATEGNGGAKLLAAWTESWPPGAPP
mmetsp:Transcript_35072/g.63215  ORF Transcript_35072/g.63215 Transcript_35072/m.63215 type:complete len:80 (+) Transcript_35072:141-380(+)